MDAKVACILGASFVIAAFVVALVLRSPEPKIGRFQIGTHMGDPKNRIYVIDTATGQVWLGTGNFSLDGSDDLLLGRKLKE